MKGRCSEQLQQITDQQHQLKLQNKQLQEQSKKHLDQVRHGKHFSILLHPNLFVQIFVYTT